MPSIGPFSIADTRVTVESNVADFAESVAWCFQDLAAPAIDSDTSPGHHFRVTRFDEPYVHYELIRDDVVHQHSLEEGYVLFHLQWEFNQIVLEQRELTIHAAGVVFDDRAVILSGTSGSGKTTLAGYLAWRDAEFLADEIVALDLDDRALPFHRPLGLRRGGPLEPHLDLSGDPATVFQNYERVVPLSCLGEARSVGVATEVGAIVFPTYTPEAPTTTTSMLPSEAFDRLTPNLPCLPRHGAPVFRRAADLVRRVPCIGLEYSDLAEAADAVRDALVSQAAT